MHRSIPALLLTLGFAACSAPAGAQTPHADAPEPVHAAMSTAALDLLAALGTGARAERAHRPFEDTNRTTWAYVPGPRAGLPLSEMTAEQRRRTHALLRMVLSDSGYLKVTGIMQLEEVLRAIETAGFPRDLEAYTLAVFGDPGTPEPWGWRFEGHHVSLNFTSVDPDGLSTSPLFLGSNPAEVRTGSLAGLRVLSSEEDLARLLVRRLPPALRSRAIVSDEAPFDILTRNDPVARDLPREGLPAGEMGSSDRLLLLKLLEVYAGNLEESIAEARLTAIREAGIENLNFVWMGSTEPGEPHYYRIHGPTLLIEYDNVQSDANHIHTVWRDLENDFGIDLFRQHYKNSPHHHP
ncbi:MAG: DUF3500 domain-containing protein [Gemmatimonadales bacterium]|nr:MAG: DUF3500 domain-containing protein [Gemmatimonadales bacterium]